MQVLNAFVKSCQLTWLFTFFAHVHFSLMFIRNVATIPQKKKKEFLTKASLFIAGLQHFGCLMHLPREFLKFLYVSGWFYHQSPLLKIFLSFRMSVFLAYK